ncbi:MAG TPA: FAD-binding protein, partial [Bacillota bacterium]
EAGRYIEELPQYGVTFVSKDGTWDRVRGPGHSLPRTYRVRSDRSGAQGLAVTLALRAQIESLGVQLLEGFVALALLGTGERLAGAVLAQRTTGRRLLVEAKAVVLATGGAAFLYERTNATRDVHGDALALALAAGATLRDMEMVQFHPTRCHAPVSMFLTEGLTADGARLLDRYGREFMHRYHPAGNMAPRDARSAAIFDVVQRGEGVDGGVWLDCSTIPPDRLMLRHGELVRTLRKHGVDFPRTPLIVSPAAHFLLGGLAIDPSGSVHGVPGCFAAGECTGGIHGANRLGGMGFPEALVFGARAGAAAAAWAKEAAPAQAYDWIGPEIPSQGAAASTGQAATAGRPGAGLDASARLSEMWRRLRRAVWRYASITRDASGLNAALDQILELQDDARRLLAAENQLHDRALAAITELRLALRTAEAIVRSAQLRTESRGAHRRSDHPESDPRWEGSVLVRQVGEDLRVTFRPTTTPT